MMPAWGLRTRRGVLALVLPFTLLGTEDTLAKRKKRKGKGKGRKKKRDTCPSGDAFNCDDFATQAEAQRLFEQCGGPTSDRYGLDTDRDGIACEHLP
jgi:hypothetical protein